MHQEVSRLEFKLAHGGTESKELSDWKALYGQFQRSPDYLSCLSKMRKLVAVLPEGCRPAEAVPFLAQALPVDPERKPAAAAGVPPTSARSRWR